MKYLVSLLVLFSLGLTGLAVRRSVCEPMNSTVYGHFEEVAQKAGIDFRHVSGGAAKDYLLESVGGGVAVFDYDNDGWLDIYFVNGSTFEALDKPGASPARRNKLFRNKRDGTFSDVTERAGVGCNSWGMGAAAADFDNDGSVDLYVTNFGKNILYRNNGDGTFSDVTENTGLGARSWSTGAAWGDYDRDGFLDLYVARYLDFDRATTPPKGGGKFCQYRGLAVQCGPRGLKGLSDILFRNNGDGTFTDVTRKALGPGIPQYYGFTPLWGDFNGDGWPDLFVANDGTPNLLYLNRGNGTFEEAGPLAGCAYSGDGREQAGMGADFGDYDHDGRFDLIVTNFSDDYNALYRGLRPGEFKDATEDARLMTVSWKQLGWAAKFFDFDLDGWLDLFVTNGHVYPEVDQWKMDTGYKQRPQLFRNHGNGTFKEITGQVGIDLLEKKCGRGAAFGDLDNDGDLDVVINNLDESPQVLLSSPPPNRSWLLVRLQGTRSNRDGIGARLKLRCGATEQVREVHQGGGFLSSNDIRAHFGVDGTTVDELEIRWPSGNVQVLKDVKCRQILNVQEPI